MTAVLDVPTQAVLPEAEGSSSPKLYEMTVEKYHQLIEAGIFSKTDKVELIEGRIVEMSPKGLLHSASVRRINKIFHQIFAERAVICSQDPITLNNTSEPEPDFVLAQLPEVRYMLHHPTPEDIFMVLEVADSSLAYDRNKSVPLFAKNGILQFCLLNIRGRELEDYREPSANGYRTKRTYSESESFSFVAFPDVEIKVSDLLPPLADEAGNN